MKAGGAEAVKVFFNKDPFELPKRDKREGFVRKRERDKE